MMERFKGISRDTWRDAVRRGVQSGVAAALAYLAATLLGDLQAFLVIMMAVTSLQMSVATLPFVLCRRCVKCQVFGERIRRSFEGMQGWTYWT